MMMVMMESPYSQVEKKRQRYTLAGTVHAAGLPPILCYCVHLEVKLWKEQGIYIYIYAYG